MRVRAAVLEGIGRPLHVDELELAAPGPGEVRVRLHASGVCHSDYNAFDGTAATRCPAVLGHEGAGVVEAVGEGAGVAEGARVMLSWVPACGHCDECLRGLSHLCANAWRDMGHGGLLDGTPRLSRDGEPVYHYSFLSTFAERTVVPAACCIPIPEGVPFEVAALAGCAVATGTGAVWRTAGVRPGERVAVLGCGGVGMSALLGAIVAGADPVVAIDVSANKLAAAEELGATHAIAWAGDAERTAERVLEVTGGGVDYAIEATGRPEAALAAFLSTRARGAAVLVGIPRADATITLPALPIPRLERRILGSMYGSSRPERDFPALLELYRRGRLPLDRLVSRRLPLDAVEEAFGIMRDGAALRVVLDLEDTELTDPLDGRIGEFWSGEVPNGSHINVVLARRGSPTAAAAAGALAGPRPGHTPFLACLSPGVVVRPVTVVVNKSPIGDEGRLGQITWGAAQLGIAQGVLDAVADGVVGAAEAADVVVLVAVWVDPAADDETAVRRANRAAMRGAIADALDPPTADAVRALVERREDAANIYYGGA